MLRPLPLALTERISPAGGTPLYMQIIGAIVRDIERGRLKPGTYLPSSRELAAELGVSRKTVVIAYDELIAQGWLVSVGTRGTLVSPRFSDPVAAVAQPGLAVGVPENPLYRLLPAPERPLAVPDGSGLKLDEGAPDVRLFPTDTLAKAYRHAIRHMAGTPGLAYRDPLGLASLRTNIAEMLGAQRGLNVSADRICITRGSQNAIFLVAQVLIRPADMVLFESLTYEPAVAAFRTLGARTMAVPLDRDGIDVVAVEQACRQHPVRALFLTPHHQFPTTVALQPERRLRLLTLARQFGFAIIEDDYDHEFHFASQPLLPMSAYAPDHVIYIGPLSKLLLPALRIGNIAPPAAVTAALAHAVALTDGMGNALTEAAVDLLIREGELHRHARRARSIYAERRGAFAAQLTDVLGDDVQFDLPDGGLAFWLRFPMHDMDRMEARMTEMGLRFAASTSYMLAADAPRGLRVGFASLAADEADVAVGRLRAALDSH